MNKRELALLERCFEEEISASVGGGVHLYQTRSKVAAKLEADGLVRKRTMTLNGFPPIDVSGFELTELGRLTYCTNAKE